MFRHKYRILCHSFPANQTLPYENTRFLAAGGLIFAFSMVMSCRVVIAHGSGHDGGLETVDDFDWPAVEQRIRSGPTDDGKISDECRPGLLSALEPQGSSLRPIISSDSHIVVFETDDEAVAGGNPNGVADLVVVDLVDKTLTRIEGMAAPSNGNSQHASMNFSGQFITFESTADNLVANDTNRKKDIFVYDRDLDDAKLVSVSETGVQSNGHSHSPVISADAQTVVFVSSATNLVNKQVPVVSGLYTSDLASGQIESVNFDLEVSQNTMRGGFVEEPDVSGDGRFIVFTSFLPLTDDSITSGIGNLFLYDRSTKDTVLVSKGVEGVAADGRSEAPSISDDGRWIVFSSRAKNLIENDMNNGADIFLYDRLNGATTSLTSQSEQHYVTSSDSFDPQISADGKYVFFKSNQSLESEIISSSTYGLFMLQLSTGKLETVSELPLAADHREPQINGNEIFVVYSTVVTQPKKSMNTHGLLSVVIEKITCS